MKEDGAMNELDRLRRMLQDAGIPYEDRIEKWREGVSLTFAKDAFGDAGLYIRNQVIYRQHETGWEFDGVCQLGSYDAKKGMIESYGELGVGEDGEPMVLNAEQAFEIIEKDWRELNARNN